MSSERLVREFHEKYLFPVGKRLAREASTYDGDRALRGTITMLRVAQKDLDGAISDLRAARARLMVEELRELVEGLLARNDVAAADGAADLEYVVAGTAVAYGWPLERLVAEVHRSNMTKSVGQFKPAKGPEWSPPDVQGILARHRYEASE